MKIEVSSCKSLKIDTEGWMPFGEFIGKVLDYLNKRQVSFTNGIYELQKDEYMYTDPNSDNVTIELGPFIVASCGIVVNKIATIGILIRREKGKREFRILGVDFCEAGEIISIPGVDESGMRC